MTGTSVPKNHSHPARTYGRFRAVPSKEDAMDADRAAELLAAERGRIEQHLGRLRGESGHPTRLPSP